MNWSLSKKVIQQHYPVIKFLEYLRQKESILKTLESKTNEMISQTNNKIQQKINSGSKATQKEN